MDKVESHITQMAYDSMDFSQGVGDAISETLLEQVVETGSFLQAAITVKPYSETYEKNSGIVEGNKENHKLMAEASVRDPRVYGLGHLYGNVAIMAKGVVEVIGGVGTAVGGIALTGGSLVAAGATYGAAAPAVAVSWGAVGAGGGLIVDGALSVGNGYENSKVSIRLIQNAGGGGRGEGIDKTVFKNGNVTAETIGENLEWFSGKSADEIADALTSQGYDVTIRNSARSSSGAQIIEIHNNGSGMNITQVQVSPGGGRHGANPYIKISTSDQGIFKIVDGVASNYLSNAVEKATIFFIGGQ
ncbi:hypothetical protein ACR6HW_08215 [Fusibacter sp. JL298sf-3]